jgi:hypothetical protein
MSRLLLGIVALMLTALSSSDSAAQTLWQSATHGMTVAQVKQSFPKAIQPEVPETLGNGAKELLRERGVAIGTMTFDARFMFKDGKLEQVTLAATDRKAFNLMMSSFDEMRTLLRARYGSEVSSKVDRDSSMGTAKADWLHGRTNISLLLIGIGGNPAVFNINYQVRLAREADRL